MNPFVAALISAIALLQGAVVYLLHKETKTRASLKKQYRELSRRLFEVSLLNSLQDKIGYSLSIKTIAETIAFSVQELFEISTVSYMLVDDNHIIFKPFLREGVQDPFLQEVERLLIQGIQNIDPETLNYKVVREEKKLLIESYTVLPFDTVPKSFFNIPLVVNNKVVGMINVASRDAGVYQEEDMSMLYKIVNQAEDAYQRLQNVIYTEEAKIESMVSTLPTGIVLLTLENNKLNLSYLNASAREILHLTTDATLEQTIAAWYPEIPMLEHIKNSIEKKEAIFIRDILIKGKTLHLYINPIFVHETEKIVGVSIAIRNMTIEKQLSDMKQNFTDMVVHELRAPLTSIKGASSLLIAGKLQPQEAEKMLQLISDSSARMMDDVGDLLDAAKIEEGRFQISPDSADINTLVKEKVALFSFTIVSKNLELETHLDENIPSFVFDKVRIGQVINNLISNSVKYTPKGGKIIISTTLQGASIKVSVSDTGIGIPRDKKALIFSKYGQVHKDLLFAGTGLGLYISKGIVESHHGSMEVVSEGKGTTISFSLPFVQKHVSSYHPSQKLVN